MKIVFIRPHSNIHSAPAPIGILSLIGYLRDKGDYEFSIIDGRAHLLNAEALKPLLAKEKPDLIGITSFSIERKEAHNVARMAKSIFPQVPLVLGGPYTTGEWENAIQDPNIDYAVVGEGEVTFKNLLDSLQAGEKQPDIKGLVYKFNGKSHFSGVPDYVENLDDIPMIAWDAIDLEFYFKNKKKRAAMNPHLRSHRVVPIMTTRGCPYHCAYCHNVFGKKIRQRSVEHVIKELRYLKDTWGVKEIDIVDDIFNLDRERAKQICDRIIEEKFNFGIAFPNGLRADQMDEELIDKLVEAGTFRIIYAIESGSPRIQKAVKKNLNLEKALYFTNYTAKKNISVGGFFMLGFLDETEAEMMKTVDFAVKSKMVTACFFVLQPFPNTEIFNQAVAAGYVLPDMPQEHYYNVTYNISKVSTERIYEIRDKAIRKFYFSLPRIIRFFRTTPIKNALGIKIKMMVLYFLGFSPEKKQGAPL